MNTAGSPQSTTMNAAHAAAIGGAGVGAAAAADPLFDTYAERAHGLKASEIRALFAVASMPEVVSLAGGMPFISGLPLDQIADSLQRLIREQGATFLQYGNGQGLPRLREQIVDVVALEGIETRPENVVITTGSQQALDLVTELTINPGDVILTESPSYVGALGVFRSYQADVRHVEMDADGMVPAALEAALADAQAAGDVVKFAYIVPNYHNPGGVTLSLSRRREIVDICRRYRVLIVEDNPYGLLGFDGEPLPAMQPLNPAGVVYLGSFSKTFAPGFRVGWVIAPDGFRDKLVLASESAILCPSNASQMAISTYLETCDWRAQIASYRDLYRQRRDAVISALEEYLPEAEWNVPGGGFYVWVKLPPGVDSRDMLPRAVESQVAYVPGTAFYYDDRGTDHLRLSYCYPTPERIREGVRRLAGVVRREMSA